VFLFILSDFIENGCKIFNPGLSMQIKIKMNLQLNKLEYILKLMDNIILLNICCAKY